MKNPAAETAGRPLFECLFFWCHSRKRSTSGILPERFRTSRNDRNLELWQRPQGVHANFEEIVQIETETGAEFWLARDLQQLLGYARWENFIKVIDKAKTSCTTAGYEVSDHFLDVTKMIEIGKGGKEKMI